MKRFHFISSCSSLVCLVTTGQNHLSSEFFAIYLIANLGKFNDQICLDQFEISPELEVDCYSKHFLCP